MTVAAATAADVDLIVALMREFYASERLAFDERVARAALAELVASPAAGSVQILRVAGQPAGYFVLTFGFSLEFHGRYAYLDELYLRAEHRGRGLGRGALDEAVAIARRAGVCAIRLEVARENEAARALYRAAGFVAHERDLLTKWIDGAR